MFFELFDAFSPRDHLSPGASAMVVFGLVPGALVWTFRALHRRVTALTRELARYESARADTRLVEGHVQRDDDTTPAATLHVEEDEEQRQGKHGTWSAWVPRGQRTHARPFSVQETDGRITRVEPGEAPSVDPLTTTEDPTATVTRGHRRTRTLLLKAGTRVWIYGRVVASEAAPAAAEGYRAASPTPALRAPEDGPLEVLAESPLPPLRAELERARGWRILCPIAVVLVELIAFSTYFAQVTSGRALDATVTRVETGYVHGGGGRSGGSHGASGVRVVCAEPNDRAEASRWGVVCSQVADDDVARFQVGARTRVLTVAVTPDAKRVGEHGSVSVFALMAAVGTLSVLFANLPRGAIGPLRTCDRGRATPTGSAASSSKPSGADW